MLEIVKRNAIRFGFKIETGLFSFETIPKNFNSKFNYVISMGNTIAHLNTKQLQKAIIKIFHMLIPGGKVFLHILNYDMLRKQGKRINNISEENGIVIIRFYDFIEKDIDFNILSFKSGKPKDFQLYTTRHYPHNKNIINNLLTDAGFKRIRFMKNFEGDKFSAVDSKDMFIIAEK
jgi:SAM-dependent methyltransferase